MACRAVGRAGMRGSTKKRGATWAYVVDLGNDNATGRRRQLFKRGFPPKKLAEEALTQVLDQINQRQFVRPVKGTLGAYLLDQWLPTKKHDLRESTWHGYDKQIAQT